jgi:energy-coupling factor transport system permease protein
MGKSGLKTEIRLDARARIVSAVLLALGLMMLPWGPSLWSCATVSIIGLLLAKPPFGRLRAAIAALSWMLLITLVVHGFSTPGHVLLEVPLTGWRLTLEGVAKGALFSGRLAAVMVLGAAVSLTIGPLEGIRALESLGRPLSKIGVPVGTITLVLALALRFVPTLFEEAQTLRKALLARGWSPGTGAVGRVKAWIPLFIPVLASGLRRSDDIAETLVLRGYDPVGKRTSIDPSIWGGWETFATAVALLPWLIWVAGVIR